MPGRGFGLARRERDLAGTAAAAGMAAEAGSGTGLAVGVAVAVARLPADAGERETRLARAAVAAVGAPLRRAVPRGLPVAVAFLWRRAWRRWKGNLGVSRGSAPLNC